MLSLFSHYRLFFFLAKLVRWENQLLQIFLIQNYKKKKADTVKQTLPLKAGNSRDVTGLGLNLYLIFSSSPLQCILDFEVTSAWISLLHFLKQMSFCTIIVQNQPMLIPTFLQRFCLLHTLIMKPKYNWSAISFSYLFESKYIKNKFWAHWF